MDMKKITMTKFRTRLLLFLITYSSVMSQPTQDIDQCFNRDTCVDYMISQVNSNLQQLKETVLIMQNDISTLKTENEALQRKVDILNSTKKDATKYKDCSEMKKAGVNKSDIYTIYPSDKSNQEYPIKVFCDMETNGGGWTVFQHRFDGSMLFNQTWNAYRDGFGQQWGEFWLGNKYLHMLTQPPSTYILRIDLTGFDGASVYASYYDFQVASAEEFYKLTIGSYSGNAGDSLTYHNNQMFSTYDEDHDITTISCSSHEGGNGGFWYKMCQQASLNAIYYSSAASVINSVHWNAWRNWESLKETRMMLRPSSFSKF